MSNHSEVTFSSDQEAYSHRECVSCGDVEDSLSAPVSPMGVGFEPHNPYVKEAQDYMDAVCDDIAEVLALTHPVLMMEIRRFAHNLVKG